VRASLAFAADTKAMPQRAQHARLADAGLADEDCVSALATRIDEALDRALARGGNPEVGVADLRLSSRLGGPFQA
jgi:hypothetical protein